MNDAIQNWLASVSSNSMDIVKMREFAYYTTSLISICPESQNGHMCYLCGTNVYIFSFFHDSGKSTRYAWVDLKKTKNDFSPLCTLGAFFLELV
jgi:hypothetical protein